MGVLLPTCVEILFCASLISLVAPKASITWIPLLASSFWIVPTTAPAVPTAYPVPLCKVSATVSSGSTSVSAVGSTVTVAVAEPAAIVTLLLAGVAAMPL